MKRGKGVLLAALPAFAAAQPVETRELFAVKEFPAFKVMVPSVKSDWCGSVARVTIQGESGEQFMQNRPVVERIVGGVRAVMSFECPEAARLELSGKVRGQPIYKAYAVAANNWNLEGVELRSAAQLKQIADAETMGRCDALGASPDDPEAVAAGVTDGRLDASAVIAACQQAVAVNQSMPRLRYQLARGYLKADKPQDALEQLVPAAESGHGGALALLADMTLAGAGGLDADPAAARSLYQKAAAAKFAPAAAALARFEDKTAAVAQADAEERRLAKKPVRQVASRQQAPAQQAPVQQDAPSTGGNLNTQGYEFPGFMTAVYAGDYNKLGGENRRFTQIYAVNMAETMRQVCRGSFTITELNGWRKTAIGEVDTSPKAAGEMLLSGLQRLADISNGRVSVAEMASDSMDTEAIPQQAREDAMTFIERNSCGSPTFNRFTAHMREAVK